MRLRKGWLFEKLRNSKRAKNCVGRGANNVDIINGIEIPVAETADDIDIAEVIDGIEVAADADSEKEIEELITFFKKCVLPANRSQLIRKLRDTADVRRSNIQRDRAIFKGSKHLYVLSPELVK